MNEPICTCAIEIRRRKEADPIDWPPVIIQVAHCAFHQATLKLLEACKALLEAFEGYEMLAALDIAVQEQARVAIASAEGEQ